MIFVFGRPPGLGAPFLRGLGLGVGGGRPVFRYNYVKKAAFDPD